MSAAIIATRINLFKTGLQAGQYEIDSGFEAFIVECLKQAGLDNPEIITQAAVGGAIAAPVAQKTKQLNCYNVFMQEKMAEFSAAGMAGKDKVSKVAEAWNGLSDGEKDAYKVKAKESTPVLMHSKPNQKKKGPKGLTGWQLFVRTEMPTIKADATILAKDRLGKIGTLWKALSEDQQKVYVAEAKLTHKAE
jgi:hypothetical protein